MTHADVTGALKSLLGTQDLVLADVGAAYGLPSHLRVLDSVATVCLFEPDAERATELSQSYARRGASGRVRVFPAALSASGGVRTLHVTNVPTGSSLLKPGSEAALDWGNPDYFFPVREVPTQTRRLADVLASESLPRVDFIKLDVQGAELEVLQGMGDAYASQLLGVELEVGFPGGYLSQPSFADLNKYLEAHGLTLFDLKPVRGHRYLPGAKRGYAEDVFGVGGDTGSLSKRLWEADAVYFRSSKEVLQKKDSAAIRRLAVLYCAYGFFAEAHHLILKAREATRVSDEESRTLVSSVLAWHGMGRYTFTDSLAWQSLTAGPRSVCERVWRRVFGRRLAGWLDQ